MNEDKFTEWKSWADRNDLPGLKFPGIYVCALSSGETMSGAKFTWNEDVIYIGMTNSVGGLRSRLRQFDNTISGRTGHGGADRVRYKYQDYDRLINHLLVSVASFPCNVKALTTSDLITMGEVAKFEYVCFSEFVGRYGHLPEFNDKKRSPKYSLKIGRGKS